MVMVLSAWVYMAGAQLCFWLPLKRRPDFVRRAALCFAADASDGGGAARLWRR